MLDKTEEFNGQLTAQQSERLDISDANNLGNDLSADSCDDLFDS